MQSPSLYRAKRSIGALFFSVFGGIFFLVGAVRGYGVSPILLGIILVCTAGIVAFAYGTYSVHKSALAQESETPEKKRADTLFHIINAGQWVVILIGGNVLANIGLSSWILPMATAIIGLHFLPLAKLFRYPPHYITGCLLLLWAISYPLILPLGGENSFGCFGAGFILWASALYGLLSKPHESAAEMI
ncbi:MAG TPA: hypothetical protein VMU30_03425 [Bacteroidota bacterium]|nr:hypothetical protein [Bacteroidota bacterium]